MGAGATRPWHGEQRSDDLPPLPLPLHTTHTALWLVTVSRACRFGDSQHTCTFDCIFHFTMRAATAPSEPNERDMYVHTPRLRETESETRPHGLRQSSRTSGLQYIRVHNASHTPFNRGFDCYVAERALRRPLRSTNTLEVRTSCGTPGPRACPDTSSFQCEFGRAVPVPVPVPASVPVGCIS